MDTNNYSGESAYTRDVASSYESDREGEEHWRDEQRYAQKIIKAMPEGSRVLDLPVGTGRFFEYYLANAIQVVGVDISESMLAEAGNKAESASIQLALGDARALDYPDDAFDFVLCWRLLHLLPPELLQEVVCELARVTTGKLYLQAYVRDRWYYPLRFKGIVGRVLSRIMSPRQSLKRPWSHIQSYEHREAMLVKIFTACGLRIQSIDSLTVYGALKVRVYVLKKV